MNQGFECEIDDRDWILFEQVGKELVISFQSDEENLGGVTLGSGQVQNLIEYLLRVKQGLNK